MKIYTKRGDTGQTLLLGGTRVPKHHIRVEAYGTIDELNACLGVLATQRTQESALKDLHGIQNQLFELGALLATAPEREERFGVAFSLEAVHSLEHRIDEMTRELPELKNFILPGGTRAASQAHVARTVCRRAERITTQLNQLESLPPEVLAYLNRLSDYLFVLARYLNWRAAEPEVHWKAKSRSD